MNNTAGQDDARTAAGLSSIAAPSSLSTLLSLPVDRLARVDIARVNLLCAEGLPGAERLDRAACLATLEHWTVIVRRFVRDAMNGWHRQPEEYHHERGFHHFLSMVTALKHPRGLGICYSPSAIGNDDFSDSQDDFLHGVLTRRTGTCVSLPTLYVAIGRRLGWPIHLSLSKGHVFCQWVKSDGARINLEGSCPGGGTLLPDEYYQLFPRQMSADDVECGSYLRPLTRPEELALFLETRGHCFADNGRFDEARVAYGHARRIAPHWSQFEHCIVCLDHVERHPSHPTAFALAPSDARSYTTSTPIAVQPSLPSIYWISSKGPATL